MRRVVGLAACALLTVTTACTSGSDGDASDTPTKHVAVEPEEVVRHEATAGTPIAYQIDVPEGAVQVGPLVRQRRVDVANVLSEGGDRADAFTKDPDEQTDPETRDPEEPTPPDFTTALLRIDGDPSEVVEAMFGELTEDTLEDSGVDPEKWRDYCTVEDGKFTGCYLAARGTTDEDEHVAVQLTVYPGDLETRLAAAGSLLRPVMVLTLERLAPPNDEDGQGDGEGEQDPPNAEAQERQNAIDAHEAEEAAIAKLRERDTNTTDAADKGGSTGSEVSDDGATNGDDQDGDSGDEGDDNTDEPNWPTMKREHPAKPGDWILTPKWKIRPNTEVILSSATPKVAMLAVKDGADTEAIARRYVRAFADEATTPKIDEVEDRNERSITYTPRNDGTGPAVAVTAVATGRGNYIELLFADGSDSLPGPVPGDDKGDDKSGSEKDDKPGSDKPSANRTTSSTGRS